MNVNEWKNNKHLNIMQSSTTPEQTTVSIINKPPDSIRIRCHQLNWLTSVNYSLLSSVLTEATLNKTTAVVGDHAF